MQAFILAAGLGTRLKPFTSHHPKPLAVVQNKPLLQHVIEHLKASGVTKVYMNLHAMPEQIIHFLETHNNFNLPIQYIIEKELLETGGGLMNIADLIDRNQPLIMMNADMLTNIDLGKMMSIFCSGHLDALLAVQNRASNRKLLFNTDNILVGWKSLAPMQYLPANIDLSKKYQELAFSGIQIIHPQLIEKTQLRGRFSIIDLYLELCHSFKFKSYLHDEDYLLDVGTPERLAAAQHLKL